MLYGHNNPVMCWAITRDNIYVIACSPNDPIIIWNIKEKTQEATLGDDSIFIMALAITSDNKYIILGDEGGELQLWILKEKMK